MTKTKRHTGMTAIFGGALVMCGIVLSCVFFSKDHKSSVYTCVYEATSSISKDKDLFYCHYTKFAMDSKSYLVYEDDVGVYSAVYEIDMEKELVSRIRKGNKYEIMRLEGTKQFNIGDETFSVDCYSCANVDVLCEPFWYFFCDEYGFILFKERGFTREMTYFKGEKDPVCSLVEQIKKDTVFYNLWNARSIKQ
ncbi:hypothetical protein EYV94_28000 [Puteibacter caeruleilacunae]|nr:hypothetical protein EYV94_28000 [Puteibacter caeruleilacunae]